MDAVPVDIIPWARQLAYDLYINSRGCRLYMVHWEGWLKGVLGGLGQNGEKENQMGESVPAGICGASSSF